MKFGVFTMNAHSCSRPETAAQVAMTAERLGFESLWCGEHVVMPEPPDGNEPLGPRDPILDPLIALAHLAGRTSRIKLATGILILPLRNPIVLAKQLSSLDVVSQGRLILGIGVGWLRQEFAAVGVDFEERGALADEYIETMACLWNESDPCFEGRYHKFAHVHSRPQPLQQGGPPLVVGGSSAAAMRRAARYGHGWFSGLLQDDENLAHQIARLRSTEASVDRDSWLGPLEVTASVKGDISQDRVRHLAGLGVDRLIMIPRPGVADEALSDWLEAIAAEVGGELGD